MSISKKTEKDAPKRPASAYFKFRAEVLDEDEVKGKKGVNELIKNRWDGLGSNEKNKYKAEF